MSASVPASTSGAVADSASSEAGGSPRSNPAGRPARRLAWTLATAAGDAIALGGAFMIAYWLRYALRLGPDLTEFQFTSLTSYWPVGVGFGVVTLFELLLHGAYERRLGIRWLDEVPKIVNSALIATAAVIVVFFLFRPAFFSRLMFGYLFVLGVAGVSIWRLSLRLIVDHRHRRGHGLERVVIVGSGIVAKMLMQQMRATSGLGLKLLGFVDDAIGNGRDFGRFSRLGGIEDLDALLVQHAVDRAVIALPSRSSAAGVAAVEACRRNDVSFTLVPDLVELQTGRISAENIAGIPLITLTANGIQGLRAIRKRAIDLALATLVLLALSPLILIAMAAIRLDSSGSVFFRQTRIGKLGKPFTLYKFRSMVEDAAELREMVYPGSENELLFKRRDDLRRTRVGRLLRRLSFDEIPQLINVLKGDMSLVGPRAQVPEEVALYDDWAKNRLQVPPGLTGLWQVSGRSNLSFEEMVMLDTYYIGHWSTALDIKILLRTIPAVIRGEGAY